jgi:hypothetical protein
MVTAGGDLSLLSDLSKNYTVFAPNEAAFQALGPRTRQVLFASVQTSQDYDDFDSRVHIYPDYITSSMLRDRTALQSTSQFNFLAPVFVSNDAYAIKPDIFIGTARIVQADVLADNGVLHKIDSFFVEPLIDSTFLVNANSNLTIFGSCAALSSAFIWLLVFKYQMAHSFLISLTEFAKHSVCL